MGADWVKPGNIVGNGPYTVVEWLPNTHVKAEKNAAFYDAASVSIDTVQFFPSEERNAATKQFRAGEIDIQYDFASEQIDWLKENLPDETRIFPWLGVYYYAINTRKAPFDDPALRQALALAIDREAITDKVLRTGELPAYSFVPPGTGNYGEPAYVSWKDTRRRASVRTIRCGSSCATTPQRTTRRSRWPSLPCGSSSAFRRSCSTARSRCITTTSRRATSKSRAQAGVPTTTTPTTSSI
jgi:ABC-type oligopeptide transport system substrate-binding subunit